MNVNLTVEQFQHSLSLTHCPIWLQLINGFQFAQWSTVSLTQRTQASVKRTHVKLSVD